MRAYAPDVRVFGEVLDFRRVEQASVGYAAAQADAKSRRGSFGAFDDHGAQDRCRRQCGLRHKPPLPPPITATSLIVISHAQEDDGEPGGFTNYLSRAAEFLTTMARENGFITFALAWRNFLDWRSIRAHSIEDIQQPRNRGENAGRHDPIRQPFFVPLSRASTRPESFAGWSDFAEHARSNGGFFRK